MNNRENAAERLRQMSPADFLQLGRSEFVYVRPEELEGKTVFSVYNASGDNLFMHESYDAAVFAAKESNLHPFTLH